MAFAALHAACENFKASSDFSAVAALSIRAFTFSALIGFYLQQGITGDMKQAAAPRFNGSH
jgi:hypothetical protein